MSVRRSARRLDDRHPDREVVDDQLGERGRRHRRREIESLRPELLLRFGRGEDAVDIGVEARDDLRRRARRRHEPEPRVHLVTLDAQLVQRWHVRQERRALEARDAERLHLAVLDLADHRRRVEEPHRHFAGHHGEHALRRALVGDVDEIGPGHLAEQHPRQVVAGAAATRRERELAWLRFRFGDHVRRPRSGAARRDDHHVRHAADERDRREVLRRVVAGI